MSQEVLICGSMAFDTIAVFDGRFKEHILADRIHMLSVSFLVPQMRREFGGCAGNIAYNLKMLGGAPVPVATIGEDAVEYLDRFKEMGIETRHLRVVPQTFTAQCFITTDLDDNQIAAFHPGAMEHSADNEVNAQNAAWAIVAPDSKAGMMAHVEKLAKTQTSVMFDLGQAMPLFNGEELLEVVKQVDALALNDYEASVVEERTGQSIQELAKNLQAIVVTRGGEGADLYTAQGKQSIAPVPATEIVDPTGCGDAHRAGLLFGLTQGMGWEKACMLGNVLGSIKIASRGPQNHVFTRDQIEALLQKTYNQSL